jgi:hypothetical protein
MSPATAARNPSTQLPAERIAQTAVFDLEIADNLRRWNYGACHETDLAPDSPDNFLHTTRRLYRLTASS